MWVKLGPRSLEEEETLLRKIDTMFLRGRSSFLEAEEKVGEDTEQFLQKKKKEEN